MNGPAWPGWTRTSARARSSGRRDLATKPRSRTNAVESSASEARNVGELKPVRMRRVGVPR